MSIAKLSMVIKPDTKHCQVFFVFPDGAEYEITNLVKGYSLSAYAGELVSGEITLHITELQSKDSRIDATISEREL